MIVDQRLCGCGSGLRAVRCCADGFVAGAAAGGEPAAAAGRRARPRIAPPGRRRRSRAGVPRSARTGADPARRADPALPDPQGRQCRARRRRAAAAHRGAAPEHVLGDQPARARPVQQGRRAGSRGACPQRGAHRAGEPAIALPDGHGHDRGQPAADRRVPLPPGARADPRARPDPDRQPRLEPEEPGPHDGGARRFTRRSVAASPEVLQTLLGWARLEEADRNLDAAAELLDRAERVAPGNPERVAGARRRARPQPVL